MARDITKRLSQLRTRRNGLDRLPRLAKDAQIELLANSAIVESWQMRSSKPYTRYALGAMQEVGPDYTRISLGTAERVGKQLAEGLTAKGFSVSFRLQGSVPLNVHIRGVSDVDILNIDTSFLVYDVSGRLAPTGHYGPTGKTSVGVLSILRGEIEKILKEKFPAATVDTSGGKAVNISGGSLARPVDVVPSHWWDTISYQKSQKEEDRGIYLLNKKVPETIQNLPFLHIKHIHERDQLIGGGLKKAIRLCKNVKSDAMEEGSEIPLPSFDIAATMYHADIMALHAGRSHELGILAEAQRHLDNLARNHEYAKTLLVPDQSRRIFDSTAKLRGLNMLSDEMDDLAREVAKEHSAYLSNIASPPLEITRSLLSAIPLAAA